ncbi:MAG TPA: ABC transporter permease [Thermoflexia bacterium]|nr:ABC transporter permease [Thermoflexia bacterium]
MARFVLRRLVRGAVALLLFQTLIFALVQALPYDFSAFFIVSPSLRAFIREELGLDRPLWEQYARWMWGFVRLDLGRSFLYWPAPVSRVILSRLPRTLLLFLPAAVLAYLFGIWLGKEIAWRRGGMLEVGASLFSVAAYTSFAPWLGFVLLNVFGWYLRWLPYQRLVNPNVWFNAPVTVDRVLIGLLGTGGGLFAGGLGLWWATRRITDPLLRRAARIGGLTALGVAAWMGWNASGIGPLAADVLAHLVLPLGTVFLLSFGETMMTMRAAMLDSLREDYVLTARAKGLPGRVIRDRHVARNAILPVLARLALSLPFVLVGSLVVERVFMWHAMGQALFDAIEFQDIPVILGILSVVGVLVLLAHIVLDVLYAWLDPRVRYPRGE